MERMKVEEAREIATAYQLRLLRRGVEAAVEHWRIDTALGTEIDALARSLVEVLGPDDPRAARPASRAELALMLAAVRKKQ